MDQPQKAPPPLIGVSCCRKHESAFPVHSVGEKYITAISDAAKGLPVLIPALGERIDPSALLDRLDGLFLTGSPSNVEPHHYAGGPEPEDNQTDPARDATTFALIREALAKAVPFFAVCRGIQELNVALGGTLHQELHEVPGKWDHRSLKDRPWGERYGVRQKVRLRPDGVLAGLFEAAEVEVNSLHGQGIEHLAPGLRVEATALDGTIEAVSVEGSRAFALGVQWHPEWKPLENAQSTAMFAAFGKACRERRKARLATL